MKIGIITLYYKNYNYGAQLQSYALWKALTDLQNDCKQISFDFWTDDLCAKPESQISCFIRCLKYGKWYINFNKTRSKIEKFRLRIPHTQKCDLSDIHTISDKFDCFVAGSDQIWNPGLWNDAFFLSFADSSKIKCAYAASTGVSHFSDEQYSYFADRVTKLNCISFREEEIIKDIHNRNNDFKAEMMPDPTFLLTREEWKSIKSERKPSEPYVLGFFLGDNKRNRDMAVEYALNHNKRYYCISGLLLGNYEWETNNIDYMLKAVSVEDFLALIDGADLFITDSFHGSVFACIFETPFITLNRFEDNESGSMNSRIRNLMEVMKLDRNLLNIAMLDDYNFTSEEKTNIKNSLELQRNKGLDFLRKTIL